MNTCFRYILLPFSLIYGIIIYLRNLLYDTDIYKSHFFDIPVISIGNITVGGTGKTPMCEYLISLLGDKKTAFLSRGYGRKSKGFVLATDQTPASAIGDEPKQIQQKFKEIAVAVSEKRVKGIQQLLELEKKPELIILDDAFQHRAVKAGLSILLIDYYRPVTKDILLPAGNLREPVRSLSRADIILYTKCPDDLDEKEKSKITSSIQKIAKKPVFFCSYSYDEPKVVFEENNHAISFTELKNNKYYILLITGIANPKPLYRFVKSLNPNLIHIGFKDHHFYNYRDLVRIKYALNKIRGKEVIILTTEKDAIKFPEVMDVPGDFRSKLYYLPIKVNFHPSGVDSFDKRVQEFLGTKPIMQAK